MNWRSGLFCVFLSAGVIWGCRLACCCPEAAAHPLHLLFQLGGQLVTQHQIHPPGQAEIIHTIHQPQTIAMAQLLGLQAEIQIRAWLLTPHRPRAEQPDSLHLGLCRERG